jgi:hypothetical protein
MDYSDNNEEMDKLILSIALSGDSIVHIDNIVTTLGCSALDRALTSTDVGGRLLGKNQLISAKMLASFIGTGNNVQLRGDTARRTLLCRLESSEEFPEKRTGFKHPDLESHIRRNHQELAGSALTILRAYVVANKPKQGLEPWGSFEGWSNLVRSAVYWTTGSDPAATRTELSKDSDSGKQILIDLLEGLEGYQLAKMHRDGFTARQVVSDLASEMNNSKFTSLREAIDEYCHPKPNCPLTPGQLGGMFKKFKGRVVQGKLLDTNGVDGNKTALWLVSKTEK